MKEKKKSFGSIILLVASYFVISIAGKATTEHLSEDYHNKILITYEYTRRVISDVYVSVTSNAFFIERNLDKPEEHREVMKRIVENGTRVHSCGISFIEDYYYPKKGHRLKVMSRLTTSRTNGSSASLRQIQPNGRSLSMTDTIIRRR